MEKTEDQEYFAATNNTNYHQTWTAWMLMHVIMLASGEIMHDIMLLSSEINGFLFSIYQNVID